MAQKEYEIKISQEIVNVCRRLHSKNYLAAADGNISYRVDESRILITPSGKPKFLIEPKDMSVVTPSGEVLVGKPSSEMAMHLEIYDRCPKAKAVVHAHPPTAIAWTVAEPKLEELPCTALSEVILATGGIPIAPYARPGTNEMALRVRPYLPQSRVLILARHGAVSWGESLDEAYIGMERLEHSAEILMKAKIMGGVTELPADEVDFLRDLRKKMGPKIL
ncbi:MAG: class II aldolase/adducin family protein [Pseudobdellovibrionaceae bacterium]|nr:class II aldolase/adducin family protein [Bdellovibrionales bacterium]USN47374.1 MAG: class II aldolase/adducin family protein [Pseudobdellovibrionaceae bacterium]